MNRTRTTLYLVLATLLLNVAPALSVCVCDVPMASDCCSAPAPEPEAKPSCCSESTPADQTTISAPACQRAVVSHDLPSVTLPSAPDTNSPEQQLPHPDVDLVSMTPPSADVSAMDRSRASPPVPSAPRLFLLDSALLI